jgi:hypothetical protein
MDPTEVFEIKRNDTAPSIRYALEPTTIDLTGASVRFKMKVTGSATQLFDKAAVVITATGTPTVQYNWVSADTSTKGFFDAEFQVTYSDTTIETFPNKGFISVHISEDI